MQGHDPTAVLCLASRETEELTPSHPTRIATKPTTTISFGPNASSLRLLEHGGNAMGEIQLQMFTK
ncbi:28369_t:CDS:2 [Gigaspora margarita]|uniref:28369_t:CDS:1 n=1 Tax=Gigaspora margarita TaxID=4874 RepID=A0ABN7UF89_GIGMA|nr:28369_t:CDS:2 [Gigaspora margarita]